MRRRCAVVGALVAMLSVVVIGADAAPATEVGWWTRNPGAMAPANGFQVAITASQEISVAALRFAIPSGPINSAILRLTEVPEGVRQDAARIKVCPTTSGWKKTSAGAYADAPTDGCLERGEVVLERSAQSTSWTGSVSDLITASTLSVKVIPLPSSDSPIEPGFEVQVGTAILEIVTASPSTPAPAPSVITVPTEPTGTDDGGTVVDPVDTPVDPAPVASVAPVAPVATTDPQADAFAPRTLDDDGAGNNRPWGRTFFFAPLAAIVGTGAVFARRTLRDRGWLGG